MNTNTDTETHSNVNIQDNCTQFIIIGTVTWETF